MSRLVSLDSGYRGTVDKQLVRLLYTSDIRRAIIEHVENGTLQDVPFIKFAQLLADANAPWVVRQPANFVHGTAGYTAPLEQYSIDPYLFGRAIEEALDRGQLESLPFLSKEAADWIDFDGVVVRDLSLGDVLRYDDLDRHTWTFTDDYARVHIQGAVSQYREIRNLDLTRCQLTSSSFNYISFADCTFRDCVLDGTTFQNCYFSGTSFPGCSLDNVTLEHVRGLNLSGAKLTTMEQRLDRMFEKDKYGYIAYKVFGMYFAPPASWEIKPGSIITEAVSRELTEDCSYGVNVGTARWILRNTAGNVDVWKVRIRFPWIADLIVPNNTEGKVRCAKVELLRTVQMDAVHEAYDRIEQLNSANDNNDE